MAIALAQGAIACGGGDEGDLGAAPGTPGTVTLLGELRPSELCDMPEVVSFAIVATRVGCDPGPPAPCTLPADPAPVEGDVATCPVTDPVRTLGVEVTEPGRYRVEAIGRYTTGETVASCFAGPDGETEIVVTQADLDAGATLDLASTESPCPSA